MKTIFLMLMISASLAFAGDKTYLGVFTVPVSEELRSHLSLEKNQGLMIRKVVKNSPAEENHLQKFDILLQLNDVKINSTQGLASTVRQFNVNDEVTLKMIRHGEKLDLKVKLGERQDLMTANHLSNIQIIHNHDDMMKEMEELKRKVKEMTENHLQNQTGINDDVQKLLEEMAKKHNMPKKFQFNGISTSVIQSSDGEHSININVKNGDKTAKVTDAKGNIVFEGPINTKAEKEAIPQEVREKVLNLQDTVKIEAQFR